MVWRSPSDFGPRWLGSLASVTCSIHWINKYIKRPEYTIVSNQKSEYAQPKPELAIWTNSIHYGYKELHPPVLTIFRTLGPASTLEPEKRLPLPTDYFTQNTFLATWESTLWWDNNGKDTVDLAEALLSTELVSIRTLELLNQDATFRYNAMYL